MPSPDKLSGDLREQQDSPYSITDNNEIWRIEAVWKDVENSEKDENMKKFIEQESKDELNKIKSQCINVIKAFVDNDDDDWRGQEKAVQAIVSLLRINQILWSVKLQWPQWDQWTPTEIKLDVKGNYLNQLKNILWNKWVDFSKILKGEEWQILNAACTKVLNSLRASQEKEQITKDNEQKASAIDTINWYIKMAWDKKWVKAAFIELKKQINSNEWMKDQFSAAVFDLINRCCPAIASTDWTLNDDFSSAKVEAFQEIVMRSDNEVAKKLLSNDMKNPVDWKLWKNTLNALVKFAEKWWVFTAEPVKPEDWTTKIDSWEEKEGTWKMLDRMPTTLDAISKYGELKDIKWYQIFSFHNSPWGPDFVKRESWTGNEYVQIAGKKFYIKWWEATDLKFKNRPVARARYWDIQKVTELCFGKFNQEWKLTEWSKIIIDSEWKQIESVIMTDATITNEDWKEEVVWLRTMWWKVKKWVDKNWNEVTRNDVKWRIDLFGKEWKDTKTMTQEQVQLLVDDFAASKAVLDQAINAFKDTLHKPSRIWRKNLNRFLHKLLQYNVNGKYRDMWNKSSVEDWLWLPKWLRSDPDEKLGELAKAEYWETKDTLVVDRIISKLEELKKEINISTKVEESETKIDWWQNKPTEVSDNLQWLGLKSGEIEALQEKQWVLHFEHLNSINSNIIKHLEGFKWVIFINSKSLTPDLMNVLKNNDDFDLEVSWEKLSDEQFKLFEWFHGNVNLEDVKDITSDQASCLSKINWWLRLNNLKRIDETVWKILESAKWELRMLRLENTSKNVAMSMIENHTWKLSLWWIDKMDSDIMWKIVWHKEEIRVRMKELDLWDESIVNLLKGLDHEVCLQTYEVDWIQNETTTSILKPLIDSKKLKIIKLNKGSNWATWIDIKF